MSAQRVLDIGLSKNEDGDFILYVPIKTGHLQMKIKYSENKEELVNFLETAYNSELRRFGENPVTKAVLTQLVE